MADAAPLETRVICADCFNREVGLRLHKRRAMLLRGVLVDIKMSKSLDKMRAWAKQGLEMDERLWHEADSAEKGED